MILVQNVLMDSKEYSERKEAMEYHNKATKGHDTFPVTIAMLLLLPLPENQAFIFINTCYSMLIFSPQDIRSFAIVFCAVFVFPAAGDLQEKLSLFCIYLRLRHNSLFIVLPIYINDLIKLASGCLMFYGE